MPALLDRALAALDEAATEAAERPIEHTKALAFVFAFLSDRAGDADSIAELRRDNPKACFVPPDRKTFVDLWKAPCRAA